MKNDIRTAAQEFMLPIIEKEYHIFSSQLKLVAPFIPSLAITLQCWLTRCTNDGMIIISIVDNSYKSFVSMYPEFAGEEGEEAIFQGTLRAITTIRMREPWIDEWLPTACTEYPNALDIVAEYYKNEPDMEILGRHSNRMQKSENLDERDSEMFCITTSCLKYLDQIPDEDIAKYLYVMAVAVMKHIKKIFNIDRTLESLYAREKQPDKQQESLYDQITAGLSDQVIGVIGSMIDSRATLILENISQLAIETAPLAIELLTIGDEFWEFEKSDYLIFDTVAETIKEVLYSQNLVAATDSNTATLNKAVSACIRAKIIQTRMVDFYRMDNGFPDEERVQKIVHIIDYLFTWDKHLRSTWEQESEIYSIDIDDETYSSKVIQSAALLTWEIFDYLFKHVMTDVWPTGKEVGNVNVIKQNALLHIFLAAKVWVKINYRGYQKNNEREG